VPETRQETTEEPNSYHEYTATFLFLLLIVVFIIRHIARKKEVDATIIVSSINGYQLLLALLVGKYLGSKKGD